MKKIEIEKVESKSVLTGEVSILYTFTEFNDHGEPIKHAYENPDAVMVYLKSMIKTLEAQKL